VTSDRFRPWSIFRGPAPEKDSHQSTNSCADCPGSEDEEEFLWPDFHQARAARRRDCRREHQQCHACTQDNGGFRKPIIRVHTLRKSAPLNSVTDRFLP